MTSPTTHTPTTVLDRIGTIHGTDKASTFHDYLRIYSRIMSPGQNVMLLEIGWGDGASMKMWRDYFAPNSVIVGVDIEPKDEIPGVYFEQVDATAPIVQEHIGDYGLFDFIIDDGSHMSPDVIATFQLLWPLVKPGGFYIIEDLHVSYHRDWKGSDTRTSQGGEMSSMHFVKMLADEPHRDHAGAGPMFTPVVRGVQSVTIHPGVAIIEKRADA